ncbi:MAG: DHHA2 domain-containing protein, partial [Fusobacteriaceae bacterium]
VSAHGILNLDMKEFNMNGFKIAIAQINTVDTDGVMKRKSEIKSVMESEVKEKGYNLFVLIVTDIIEAGSSALVAGDHPTILERAFNVKIEQDIAWLNGVVSRKKQIVPFMMAATQSME